MTLRMRSVPIVLALTCVLAIGLALPAAALAADTLAWVRTFTGPPDIPVVGADPTPVAGGFNAVSSADATHAWAAGIRWTNPSAQPGVSGTKGSLYAFSSDGGQTWSHAGVVGSAVEYFGVAALPGGAAVLVGENGTIARWNGLSWSVQALTGWSGKHLRAVAFPDALHGWAAGDGRGIAQTTDGGATWTTVLQPTGVGSWRAATAVDSTHAWVAGDGGQLRFIAGGSWTSQSAGGNALYGIDFTDTTHGLAVGHNGAFYRTANAGTSWTAVSAPAPAQGFANFRIRAVAFADPLNGIAVGAYQSVWRTTDGGDTWALDQFDSVYSDGGLEMMGAAFVADAPENPVTVARAGSNQPAPPVPVANDHAWVFRGTWTGIGPPVYNTITASAGAGGSIAPSGPRSVRQGSDFSFMVTPDLGYHVASVLVDGSPVGAVTSYTFDNVQVDHTISATFAINRYAITPSAGTGGSISPNAVQTVDHGSSIAFTIAPVLGYHVADVLVDGVSVGAVASYGFTNVDAVHTIAATFAADTPGSYTVSASAGTGGGIAPSGLQTVSAGSNVAFTITPDGGYHIADVRVDGSSVGAVASYTLANVTANHTISATFAPDIIVATSITIRTAATATTIGKTVPLSGAVSPMGMIGVNIVVYVMKPGKTYWTYSSNRTVYSLGGSPAWLYKYYFKPGMARGSYKFKARAPAPGFASSEGFATSESPTTVTIRVR